MMTDYSTLAEDYFVNMHLATEIPLSATRETVLSFFERLQKIYPTMQNFFARENGDYVLEEPKDQGAYRWVTLEARRICSGYYNPPTPEEALKQHLEVLELAPYMLSLSPLDCESIDLIYGFDFPFKGNHDELICDTFPCNPISEALRSTIGTKPLSYEPSVTVALDDSCKRQARILIETRTTAYNVKRSEYPEEPITLYFTMRQYGSLTPENTYSTLLNSIQEDCERLLEHAVINDVIKPLAQAINLR